MPVSTEEKRALNKQGFKVVGARFEPEPEKKEVTEKPKTKRKPKVKQA